jgi:hypothetical protein
VAPTDRNWLDGRLLLEWLEGRRCDLSKAVIGNHDRAVRHWREGGSCSVFQVDRVLTKLGIHLHELPDHLWLEEPPKGAVQEQRKPFPPQVKADAVRRVLVDEEPIKRVAEAVGCSPRAVRRWIERAA